MSTKLQIRFRPARFSYYLFRTQLLFVSDGIKTNCEDI